MGKPSIKSRKTSQIRSKKRKIRMIKQIKSKEEELMDLQTQFHEYKKNVGDAGEKVFNEINKCTRENNNLVKWLKIYDEQINNYEKELYNLNSRLYFSSQPQPQSQPQS